MDAFYFVKEGATHGGIIPHKTNDLQFPVMLKSKIRLNRHIMNMDNMLNMTSNEAFQACQ
jgi:hypothetical protein